MLNVENNLVSPKNSTNLLGCIADAVTGNYILNETELNSEDASQFLHEAGLSMPFSNKVSGKEVFAKLLPQQMQNIKENSSGFRVEEGDVLIRLDKEFGRRKAIDTLREVFALGTVFLSRTGFTISVDDLDVPEHVKQTTQRIISNAEEKTQKIIESYYEKTLESLPGKTLEETREIKILKVLNEVRTEIGKSVKKEFPKTNPVNKMISSKAGGSMLNITQISCSVGQQVLGGKRIQFGYTGRTLPVFKKGDLSPRAGGFIYNSFMNGLRPEEFFFGAMTGRDGLMDTALRTPKSGYLYRRLANALQDLIVAYDGTVRDASGNIIQFAYGIDGVDVSKAHTNEKVSPGEAIGLVTAQSFGESSTQMVLNVFHSAGVAEMQVTQGLPRLIEILDARKKPSTPTMEIYLDQKHNNEKDSKIIAEKIKEVKLKEVMEEISINFTDKKIEINIDNKALKQVHIGIEKIVESLSEKGFKIKKKESRLIFDASEKTFKEIYKLKEKLKETILSGIKGISQVLPVKRDRDFIILTAGSNLKEVLAFKGVNTEKIFTNDLHEIAAVLGIEAARQAVVNEIQNVLTAQGLDINRKHLMVVADTMANSGVVKGITRMGIISEKGAVLARASFETPIKHFVTATRTGKKDKLASVIENIILNQPVPVGTGLPGLLVKVTGPLAEQKSKKPETKKPAEKKIVKKTKV